MKKPESVELYENSIIKKIKDWINEFFFKIENSRIRFIYVKTYFENKFGLPCIKNGHSIKVEDLKEILEDMGFLVKKYWIYGLTDDNEIYEKIPLDFKEINKKSFEKIIMDYIEWEEEYLNCTRAWDYLMNKGYDTEYSFNEFRHPFSKIMQELGYISKIKNIDGKSIRTYVLKK